MSKARVLLSSSNKVNQLISEKSQSNVIGSQHPTIINELKVEDNEKFVVDDIIDRLTGVEFFR